MMFTSLSYLLFLLLLIVTITTGFVMTKFNLKIRRNFSEGDEIQRSRLKTQLQLLGGIQEGKKGCKVCKGGGGVDCSVCKGTGKDKVNGNVLERWTCKKCKGFGYVPCPSCSKSSKGLTPEQRGER